MINATQFIRLNDEELQGILEGSIKSIDIRCSMVYVAPSVYFSHNYELSGIAGNTFDFLARIRIAKKIRSTNLKEIIKIPYYVIEELEQNREKSIYFTMSKSDIRIQWTIDRFKYIEDVLEKYLNGEYDIKSEIIQIGFDLACIETIFRSLNKNKYLYTTITDTFKGDMIRMLKQFDKIFISSDETLKKDSDVIFNPTFGNLMTGIKADGDIVIDGCLFDFKTRKRQNITEDLKQLVVYEVLNEINKESTWCKSVDISSIGSFNPRFTGIFTVDVEEVNQEYLTKLKEYIKNNKWSKK